MSVTPTPTLGRLLISHITLRGPELQQLHTLIARRPDICYDELRETLVAPVALRTEIQLEEAPLREALNFLLVAGLVEQRGASRLKATFRVTATLSERPFALLLLHHLCQHGDERQRAISLIHRQLVLDDALAVTPQALRDQMERGPYQKLFVWTSEKIMLWTHLASFLGLVRRLERGGELLVVPQPHLLLDALHWATSQTAAGGSLDALLRVIDCSLMACYTGRQRVHRGVAQTLIALHSWGEIRLSHSSDAMRSLLLGTWRVSNIQLVPMQEPQL